MLGSNASSASYVSLGNKSHKFPHNYKSPTSLSDYQVNLNKKNIGDRSNITVDHCGVLHFIALPL